MNDRVMKNVNTYNRKKSEKKNERMELSDCNTFLDVSLRSLYSSEAVCVDYTSDSVTLWGYGYQRGLVLVSL